MAFLKGVDLEPTTSSKDAYKAIEAEGRGVPEADRSGDQEAKMLVINKLEAMVIKKLVAGVPSQSKWLFLPPLLNPIVSMLISFFSVLV